VRPRLLDLFAGEGGAAYGYMLAGFDVTAVDDVQRPGRAPGVTWVTGDATTYPLDGFDVVAGSPPCTDHTTMRNAAERTRGRAAGTAWMLAHTIARFRASGLPYVVENVDGARRLMDGAMMLCGSMFRLEHNGFVLRRHRLFLSNLFLWPPGPDACHGRRAIGVYGDKGELSDRNSASLARRAAGRIDMRAGLATARKVMGMDWATGPGLSLAIPPAYTQWIGEQLMAQLPALAGGAR